MKKYLLAVCSIFVFSIASAQSQQYARATIFFDANHSLHQLAELGIACDHGDRKTATSFTSDFSTEELNSIAQQGFRYEIAIADVAAHYAHQNNFATAKNSRGISCAPTNSGDVAVPSNFQLGSMGGYFTYQEMLDILDTLHAKYPTIVSAKQPIDTFHTIEGRPIYWVKISDNPTVNESEPQILFTAVHHAREPAGLSNLLFYVWSMVENYATDPSMKALVDNTEFYLIPCVNPDGYIYNQTTNPNGGGMWRKNRRQNANGTFGVDLNRNYGDHWGFDNSGSSPTPSSETYRGTAAFSEPETQACKWFCEQHSFKIAVNYHTYGNDLIYPWGYTANTYTPDSATFVDMAKEMTKINNYLAGTGNQTVGYNTNGDSDDWMYGEQSTKNKILAMTPEAGSGDFGFWPPATEIIPICKDNFSLINNAHKLLLRYLSVKDLSPAITTSTNFKFKYTIQAIGLDTACTFSIHLSSLDGLTTIAPTVHTISNPSPSQVQLDSFPIQINSSLNGDTTFRFLMEIDNGLFVQKDTISKIFLKADTIYYNNCNLITDFVKTGNWGLTSATAISSPSSITDSPNGNYPDNASSEIKLNQSIDLTHALSATLVFSTKFDLEKDFDFVLLQVNTENDPTNWQNLCSNLSSYKTNQGYTGSQPTWTTDFIPLTDYLGQKINLRYTLSADPFENRDGFYFDDLTILGKLDTTVNGIATTSEIAKKIAIYPNPSTGIVRIIGNENHAITTLEVHNLLGQTQFSTHEIGQAIDFSFLPKGIYLFHFSTKNGERKTIKWVKE